MFQFFTATQQPTLNANTGNLLNDPIIFLFLIIAMGVLLVTGVLFMLRAIFRTQLREVKAFERIVLQILVPKERKSEGQGGQGSQEDRLEQVREEIGLTETIFASLAGMKAQRGFTRWLLGRNDSTSFEMIAHNSLITFYVAIPKRAKPFMEQQIHAQYPHAQIEEMTDYNIFTEKSSIVGAYLNSKQKKVFPFKTYKKTR